MRRTLLTVFMLACTLVSWTQIYEPEGLNIPGDWTGWSNPPAENSAFGSYTQVTGGRVTRINTGTIRWQTIFHVAATGADTDGGTKSFKFSSGSTGNPYGNQWSGVAATLNQLQSYSYGDHGNNTVTLTNDRWYTINWEDIIGNTYNSRLGIIMETAAEPVLISSVSQSPLAGSVEDTDNVIITVNVNNPPSMGELVYVRYAINGNWANSSNALVSFTGAAGTATIPMQAAATSVSYYVFSTTVSNPAAANVDMSSIRFNNNGGSNYSYTVNTPLPPVNVTFQVDMSQVGGSAFISGSFNGWAQQAMTDAGGGIWTYTTSLNQGVSIQYKFRQGVNYEGDLLAPCGNGSNRVHTVDDEDEILDVVCYGSCSACPPPPVTVDVTFRVNMSQQTVSGNGVHIAGSFQGTWNPGNIALTDANSDDIYEVTLPIEENTSIEYKFINGNAWGSDESVAGPCSSFGNRVLSVGDEDMITNVVCFASCDNCIEGAPTQPVTFRVNMGNTLPSNLGVHLAGNFGNAGYPNWIPGGIEMTDEDGDFVYEVTLNLNENEFYDFKYVNGDSWGQDEQGLAGCEFLGNRTLEVINEPIILPRVCFNSCTNCTYSTGFDSYATAKPLNSVNNVYPNCMSFSYSTAGSSPSPVTNDNDVWFKFDAISNGVRVIASSSSDLVIRLVDSNLSIIDTEDLTGAGQQEILNNGTLIEGNTYYIAVSTNDTDGPFSICVQKLRKAACQGTPSAGYNLCSTFKSTATGASTTTFTFGNETPTSITSAGPISLSHSSLALLYGSTYNVSLAANYSLTNGLGATEFITITNNTACSIVIGAQPSIDVKLTQRCPATLYRSNFLQASPVGVGIVCGIIGYNIEFTRAAGCSDYEGDPLSTFTRTVNTAIAQISLNTAFSGFPIGSHPNLGYWIVRWQPIFTGNIAGTWGNKQIISVNGTASMEMADENSDGLNSFENNGLTAAANLYPNPNNGDMLNLNMTGITSDVVSIRIMDTMGKVVYSNRYSVDGSLNTIVSFGKPLAQGVYMVEFTSGKDVLVQRMLVNQ